MKARFNPFPKVSCRYGAPMGRYSQPGWQWPKDRRKIAANKSAWVDGDYDRGGAYWGCGTPIWAVWERGHAAESVVYVRAWSRDSAIEQAINI